jgi:hypothetical protein
MATGFNAETTRIINAHRADFDCTNCQKKLQSYGGYKAYLKQLGGVFDKYRNSNANVKTAREFQEVAQYVFGLMAIYGFDYNNGTTYVRWGGKNPFYVNGKSGKCNWGTIDDICSNVDMSKTTNCNYGMDSLYYKAGIFPKAIDSSDRFKGQVNAGMKIIRNVNDLRVGDLIHFFHSKITSNNPETWKGWGHVACVGEISDGKVYTYDTGNRFIRSGTYMYLFSVNTNNAPTGTYDNYEGWVGIRVCELAGNLGTDMYISDIAVATIHGDYGSGDVRKEALGSKYEDVQSRVNYYLGNPKKHELAKVRYTLRGYAGSGNDRKRYWGKEYGAVQGKANAVIKTALEIIHGTKKGKAYGKNATRLKNIDAELGEGYGQLVQNYINVLLGVRKKV